MSLENIKAIVQDDLNAANHMFTSQLNSDIVLINELIAHITANHGKRLRPLLLLLSAKACNYQGDKHIDLAVAIEYIHTATLLHDDVVDDSKMRRGKETANMIWGNQAAILVGDFMITRNFQLIAGINDTRITNSFADATNKIASGEVMQLMNCHDASTSEVRYMTVIEHKTASLFSIAAQLGAQLAKVDATQQKAMRDFGHHFGIAFQLIDDALDYSSTPEQIGKNIGDDLADGNPTLPLIYALEQSTGSDKQMIKTALEKGSAEQLDTIQAVIESTNAIAYTYQQAQIQIDKALTTLQAIPASIYRDGLEQLATFILQSSNQPQEELIGV